MDVNKVIIIVLLLVAVVGYIRLYRHYRRNIKKVSFLFDAIDNGDFSFYFPTEKGNKEDKILHQSLNRINSSCSIHEKSRWSGRNITSRFLMLWTLA